jgi:hypothetical protein
MSDKHVDGRFGEDVDALKEGVALEDLNLADVLTAAFGIVLVLVREEVEAEIGQGRVGMDYTGPLLRVLSSVGRAAAGQG